MKKPLLVAEDIAAARPIFRAFGTCWAATRYAWLSPASWAALGFVMAFASRGRTGTIQVILRGLGYWAVLYGANVLHSIGHVAAGRVMGTPVKTVLVTSTRDVIFYSQPGDSAPARRRLGRALGGPAANLAAGAALMLAGRLAHAGWLEMAGLMNLCIAAWTLMPVPSLDGWVVWGTFVRSRRKT